MVMARHEGTTTGGGALLTRTDLPTPRRVLVAGFSLVAALVLLSTGGEVFHARVGGAVGSLVGKATSLDNESNIPTLANFGLLLASSALLLLAAREAFAARDRFRRHWAALAAIFLLMTFDETARLHERLIEPVQAMTGASGIFHFAWILPALTFLCLFALAYLPFLLALPRRVALAMVAAGSVYVGGAVGMEMIGGAIFETERDYYAPRYFAAATIEETLEMSGLVLFCAALVLHLRRQPIRVRA